jgi:tRNA modification GTPase
VFLSAKDGDGRDELASVLSDMYNLGEIDLSSDAVVANARQFASVSLALEKALESKEALLFGQTPDIICFSLENSLSELNMIDKREVSEDVVSAIFSRFCVGK